MNESFLNEVRSVITQVVLGELIDEAAAIRIGEIAISKIGIDETLDQEFPKQWHGQEKLKKDWVHSRNHLRRSIRVKFKS